MISGNRFIISEHISQHKSRYDVSVVRVMCYVLCEQVGGSRLFPAGQAELSCPETNCSDVCQVFVLLNRDT